MAAKTVARNVYDPRVRELVPATGNPELFPDLNIRAVATLSEVAKACLFISALEQGR